MRQLVDGCGGAGSRTLQVCLSSSPKTHCTNVSHFSLYQHHYEQVRLVHLILSVPVPQIQEQIVEAIKVIPQEQMAERIVEQIVDVPVPQIPEQIVDVPVPQITEETDEVAILLVVLAARRAVHGREETDRSPRRAQPVAAALSSCIVYIIAAGQPLGSSQDTHNLGHFLVCVSDLSLLVVSIALSRCTFFRLLAQFSPGLPQLTIFTWSPSAYNFHLVFQS